MRREHWGARAVPGRSRGDFREAIDGPEHRADATRCGPGRPALLGSRRGRAERCVARFLRRSGLEIALSFQLHA